MALFQHLLIAREAGRNVVELSPVPLSLADPAGNLRSGNTSALTAILKTV